jgi:hypothetical protein
LSIGGDGESLLFSSGGRLSLRIFATFILGTSGRRGKVSALSLAHELERAEVVATVALGR